MKRKNIYHCSKYCIVLVLMRLDCSPYRMSCKMTEDVPTDPNSVPFLDIAKYRPVLTDLMATTPTLTDRISIRPGEENRK